MIYNSLAMRMTYVRSLSIAIVLLASLALAAPRKRHHGSPDQAGTFDYYLLSVSWAPNYCAGHPSDQSSECRAGGGKSFVLHGLWPQANSGPYLESCTTAPPVGSDIVNHMLNYMPSASLVQHEWQTHGTCSGLSAQDYFAKVEQAFRNLQIPQAYQQMNQQKEAGVQDLEQAFASANNASASAFRVSCQSGELVNVEVCMNKDLQYQSCTGSVHECQGNSVLMRAVR
jgi:ribonuclease T2